MLTLIIQISAATVFVGSTLILGLRIRRRGSRIIACYSLRIGRLLVRYLLILPTLAGIIYPGLGSYDTLLRLPSLPLRPLVSVTGFGALLSAFWFWIGSIDKRTGWVGPALSFDRFKTVRGRLHERLRYPKSLACYFGVLALGLLSGSTSVIIGSLTVLIPAHVFYLLYFQERVRVTLYGTAYKAYQRHVPFLIPRFHVPRNEPDHRPR